MAISSGDFFWYDVMTTDAKDATDFYKSVVGWGAQPGGVDDMSYTLLTLDKGMGMGVAGLMPIPPDAGEHGAKPAWNGYVYVDDVDAMTKKVADAGGTVHHQPDDIPTVGRFSVVADPQGAMFSLFKPLPMDAPVEWPAPGTPGTVGWHELHAADGAKAFDFYAKVFGWQKSDAIDMGPIGVYQLFKPHENAIGGIMTDQQAPHPYWTYYINVDAIDAAIQRVTDNGGTVLHGPMQVPGGSWIINGRDPQGAMFSLVAPKR